MNKLNLLIVFSVVFGIPMAANAAFVDCQSQEKVSGWKAVNTHDYVYFHAEVDSNELLIEAEIKGAFLADGTPLKASEKYNPTNPRYKGFNRFDPLEDAWRWFVPLLPEKLLGRKGRSLSFVGYMQIFSERGFEETLTLDCKLIP